MASDGYVVVQWRNDGTWFHRFETHTADWTEDRRFAMRFESVVDFRAHEAASLRPDQPRWSKNEIVFVRVSLRKARRMNAAREEVVRMLRENAWPGIASDIRERGLSFSDAADRLRRAIARLVSPDDGDRACLARLEALAKEAA
ncbi:hypothetical protein WMF38_57720 [Sorangium sp. So ce118]